LESGPLERSRTRLFFFLYSDTVERNTASKNFKRRVDFWPFFTYHRDMDGNRRWQALAVIEPFFPNNRSVLREYSQVWSFWREQHNARTGEDSQSLLWNLYRCEKGHGKESSRSCLAFFSINPQRAALAGALPAASLATNRRHRRPNPDVSSNWRNYNLVLANSGNAAPCMAPAKKDLRPAFFTLATPAC